jgi:hypothetical protein
LPTGGFVIESPANALTTGGERGRRDINMTLPGDEVKTSK